MRGQMTPTDLWREFSRPIADTTILFAMLGFALLLGLAKAAGLLGIWLYLITLPALTRYLVLLLECRAVDRKIPPPGIEMFNLVEHAWSLVPLLPVLLFAWLSPLLERSFGPPGPWLAATALMVLLPAVAAVLAVTHSPLQSLNPWAWWQFLRQAGVGYAVAPLTLAATAALLSGAAPALPAVLSDVLILYLLFTAFLVTGAVTAQSGLPALVCIRPDDRDSEAKRALTIDRERTAAVNHAYGIISRGNLDGGLTQLLEHIAADAAPADACRWCFERMLTWESTSPALFLARHCLARLLDEGRDRDAVKLLARCLHEDPAFRPLPADLGRTMALLDRLGREDLVAALDGPPR